MEQNRILIVESESAFALSLASVFRDAGCATAVAGSAAEAMREMHQRRPDLVVVRAELPDLSGFSLCARLRRDPVLGHLPVILLSSDGNPEALEEHARTNGAASGYLTMPLDTGALAELANRLLAEADAVEDADDAVVEDPAPPAGPVQVRMGSDLSLAVAAAFAPAGAPEGDARPEAAPAPPPMPQRPRRSSLTDEDRLFLDRVFQSIADHKDALLAESLRRRPPPRRQLLASVEGRLQLLREELRWREAQIARLSELWEVRQRELAANDDRLHDKDVEVQKLKLQVDELLCKLQEARDQFLEKEREHGASVETLLLEKFGQEKELIEVVATKERRIHDLERELRHRDDDLARRGLALDSASEEIARLEKQAREAEARFDAREHDLLQSLGRREEDLVAAGQELAAARASAAEVEREQEQERAAARDAADVLQHRIEERESAIREREERLRALEEEQRRAREAARQREEDLAREIRDHLEQIRALESELEQAGAEAADREAQLSERLAGAEARAGERGGLWEAARAEAARLQEELEAARGRATRREAEMEGQLATQRSRGDDLTGLLAQASQERDEARVHLQALSEELKASRSEASELGEKARALEARLAAAEEERGQVLARLQEIQSRLARAEKGAADAAARADAASRESRERLARLGAEREQIEEREREAHRALQAARASHLEELERRERARGQEVQRLHAALQEKSRQLAQIELELRRLRGADAAR